MADFFTNFAQPQQRNSLADMINMASGVQQFQQAQQLLPIQLEKAQMELQQLKQTQPLELKRLGAEARVAEETAPARISKSLSESEVANLNKFKSFLSNSIEYSAPLLKKKDLDYSQIEQHYRDSLKNVTDDKNLQDRIVAQAMQHIPKNGTPDEYRMIVGRQMLDAISQESKINKLFPTAQGLSTGEQVLPVSMGSSLAIEKPGTVIGKPIELGIPPTQQVVGPTGETKLLGPLSQRGQTTLQTGLGPAQTSLLGAGGDVVKNDWTNTSFEAAGAPGRIAIFQNIKKLVPESFTGVGGERKQFLSGLAQAIGIDANILETSSVDDVSRIQSCCNWLAVTLTRPVRLLSWLIPTPR